MSATGRLATLREEVQVSAADLLDAEATPGGVTEAPTAEISRSQVRQWPHDGVTLSDGQQVSTGLVQW